MFVFVDVGRMYSNDMTQTDEQLNELVSSRVEKMYCVDMCIVYYVSY